MGYEFGEFRLSLSSHICNLIDLRRKFYNAHDQSPKWLLYFEIRHKPVFLCEFFAFCSSESVVLFLLFLTSYSPISHYCWHFRKIQALFELPDWFLYHLKVRRWLVIPFFTLVIGSSLMSKINCYARVRAMFQLWNIFPDFLCAIEKQANVNGKLST